MLDKKTKLVLETLDHFGSGPYSKKQIATAVEAVLGESKEERVAQKEQPLKEHLKDLLRSALEE